MQTSFLFHPSKTPSNFSYDFPVYFDERFYTPSPDATVHALHFKAESSKGCVLYFHGNAGSLEDWGWTYRDFLSRQYDLLIPDYRQYGKSKGKLTEEGLYQDALFVYDDLKKEYGEENIIIYGRSIGTGIATYVASKRNVKHLILETPYYSLSDIVKRIVAILPVQYILKFKFESYKYIQDVLCPISIVHGTADRVVPYDSGEKLYSVVKEKAEFITIEGGEHSNLAEFEPYQQLLNKVVQ